MGTAVRGFAGHLVRGPLERPDVLERFVDERRDMVITQGVLAGAADSAHAEDRVFSQHPELVRDGRLLHPDGGDDTDTSGPDRRHTRICSRFGVDSANIVSAIRSAVRSGSRALGSGEVGHREALSPVFVDVLCAAPRGERGVGRVGKPPYHM